MEKDHFTSHLPPPRSKMIPHLETISDNRHNDDYYRGAGNFLPEAKYLSNIMGLKSLQTHVQFLTSENQQFLTKKKKKKIPYPFATCFELN